MPELPEVESTRRVIQRHCSGKKIIKVNVVEDSKVFGNHKPAEIERALKNRVLESVGRKGKYFWFDLQGDGPSVLFHLGMAGFFSIENVEVPTYVRIKKDEKWPPKYCKLEMVFEDNTKAVFGDGRRFGRIKLGQQLLDEQPLSKLGLDAFDELPDAAALFNLLRAKRRALKAVLLDQAVLCGIGNWIADEALYQARILPDQDCPSLTMQQTETLHQVLTNVLQVAVSVNADATKFPPDWLFHFRWTGKKSSKDFHGRDITFETAAGRTTAYVKGYQTGILKAPPKKKRPLDDIPTSEDTAEEDEEDDDEVSSDESPPPKKPLRKPFPNKRGRGGDSD